MFGWTDELATGIKIIDEQHQTLIEKINQCMSYANGEDTEKFKETLEFLSDYVIFHFGEEEKWMLRKGYEHFDDHRDKHSYFIKEVFELKRLVEKKGMGKEISSAMKLLMMEWLIDHIDKDDKKLANTIK